MRIGLFEKIKGYKYIACVLALVFLLFSGAVWHLLAQRQGESIGEIHEPGKNSITVYSSRIVTQRIRVSTNTFSAVAFTITHNSPLPPEHTPIIIHLRDTSSGRELETITKPLQELYREEKGGLLRIEYPLITHTKNVSFEFSIQAPSLSKNLPLTLAYQIDDTKYPDGDLLINNKSKMGSLGFILYEQPTVLITVARWMASPRHTLIWIGIILNILGILIILFLKNPPKQAHVDHRTHISVKEICLVAIITLLAVFAIFQPALSIFFVQDDIPILLRVKNMDSWIELIFTNHPYLVQNHLPDYAIGFYRPISYSLYPWAMYQLFGLSAIAHHAVHLVLFAILAVLIYILSRRFGPPLFASIVMGFWLVHSSKISTVYWLSSSQDILSSLFFVLAFLLYIRRKKGVLLLYTLALFSKDFSVLFPCIVLLFELYVRMQAPLGSWRTWVISQIRIQAPFIIISGIYIIIRTIALGDPTLPNFPYRDHSYDIAFNIQTILQNIIAYTHWTAEYFLWPQSNFLHSFMSSTRLDGPFYPGPLILLGYAASIGMFWKRRNVRLALIFAGVWWTILLLPNLLMINERTDRWLTLSLWGATLALTSILWQFMPSKPWIQKSIGVSMLAGLLLYGFWIARLPHTLGPYKTISIYARTTIVRYMEQKKTNPLNTKQFLKNVPEDMRGTINQDLLLLFSNDTPTHLQ